MTEIDVTVLIADLSGNTALTEAHGNVHAAQAVTHARAGQILCTERATLLASGLDDVEDQPLGLVRFKNIVDRVAVYEVVVGRRSHEGAVIDPVCRMQVHPAWAPARLKGGRDPPRYTDTQPPVGLRGIGPNIQTANFGRRKTCHKHKGS